MYVFEWTLSLSLASYLPCVTNSVAWCHEIVDIANHNKLLWGLMANVHFVQLQVLIVLDQNMLMESVLWFLVCQKSGCLSHIRIWCLFLSKQTTIKHQNPFDLLWVPQSFERLEFFHVNKACKNECCGNNSHQIIQNVILSRSLELNLSLLWRKTI